MSNRYEFDDKHAFINKLKELIKSGIQPGEMDIYMPYPVHEVDEILHEKPSGVRVFTLLGAVTGTITGFAFTTFTVLNWKLIVGGKPLVSIPAFVIVAFELTILFGALSTMLGFLLISGLPSIKRIFSPEEFDGKFVIQVRSEKR